MKCVNYYYSNVLKFVSEDEINSFKEKANDARTKLLNKTGKGNDFVGWVKWPSLIKEDEVNAIIDSANRLRSLSKILVVAGIGGSYLGTKACDAFLSDYYDANEYKIIYVGKSFSSTEMSETLDYLKDKDFSVVCISKSGSTTETAISFRFLKNLLKKKYGKDYNRRIIAVTSNVGSSLHEMAQVEGFEEYFIPADIGGRYSVLTAVGVLPLAFKGYDVKEILKGALDSYNDFKDDEFEQNGPMKYASVRNALLNKGKEIEILVSYEEKLRYLEEWWKQLFGESEGKEGKGLFPASVIYSTDLHSMGQYVQDGKRILFETVININKPKFDIVNSFDEENRDNLNYLFGKKLDYVNKQALLATAIAHVEGGVPNAIINIDELNEYNFGYLVYFFMASCGVSGYILDVNPFNQEGVEAYKKEMFSLLGKPKK